MESDSDKSSEGSEFVATSEMLSYAYDDESTINEDEDLEDNDEVDNLKLESDMPIEELLLKYAPKIKYNDHSAIASFSVDGCSSRDGSHPDNFVQKSPPLNSELSESHSLQKHDQTTEQSYDDENNHVPRGSSRLWCKALIENNSNYNSEDDGDYIPIIDSKLFSNAQIRVGDNYQSVSASAVLLQSSDEYYSDKEREVLLWRCQDDSDKFQTNLRSYLKSYGKISGQSALLCATIDDATALFSLMEHDYDVDCALLHLRNRPVRPADLPNIMQSWTEQECLEFEKGFETYYKNFRLIREQRLRTRTVAEIVEFYYFWKKTARYDEVIRWCKRDKKKPINQITDLIDCLSSDGNGRKEGCLLGTWTGAKVDNQVLQLPEDCQTAKFLSDILLRNGAEFESVLGGSWNMTTSSVARRPKEPLDAPSEDPGPDRTDGGL